MNTTAADVPTISVVVVVYNGARNLARCLDSIVGQTWPRVDAVVIDGGSTDGSVEIVRGYADRIGYWVSEKDRGIYDAMNKGVARARGEWVLFLGCDDYLAAPEVLARIAPALAAAWPDYRVVYGRTRILADDEVPISLNGQPWERSARMLASLPICHQGILHHRSLFAAHGPFDTSYRFSGDMEFLLRELKDRDALFVPDVTLSAFVKGGVSTEASLLLRQCRERKRALRAHGLSTRGACSAKTYLKYALHAVVRALFGERAAMGALRAFGIRARLRSWLGRPGGPAAAKDGAR